MDFDFSDFNPFAVTDEHDLETSAQLATPVKYGRRQARNEFRNGMKREALNDLIPTLPPPDTTLFLVGNGAGAEVRHGINTSSFDFGSFVPHVIAQLGNVGCVAYISTWTMSRIHVKSFLSCLADGRLSALTVMTDSYFKRRESAIANELISGLLSAGQRFVAFKNHAKLICIAAPDGRTCVITGSANLSAQPRAESYVLTTAPDVYAFYVREFFEAMLNRA